jgi:hypothetical protein
MSLEIKKFEHSIYKFRNNIVHMEISDALDV